MRRISIFCVVVCGVLFVPTSWAPAQSLLHGLPAYDSGWVDFPPANEISLNHGVGGNTSHYVVDLQLRDEVDGHGGGNLVHQIGIGGDDFGGAYWQTLSSSWITVFRLGTDTRADQLRVRIWVVKDAEYNSGWLTWDTPEQQEKTLPHGVGGAMSDYVVDLQFYDADTRGVNSYGYGIDQFPIGTPGIVSWGAAWKMLDQNSVTVVRGTNDSTVDQFRVRIFQKPSPDYDSGWVPVTTSTFRTHGLGGPWNDFVVDVQHRDTSGGLGINHVGFGGDDVYASGGGGLLESHGVKWHGLSGRSLTVTRGADDSNGDEVRIRIWASRAPKWDSGWVAMAQDQERILSHGLGGDPDTYVVDMQFKDTDDDGSALVGVNQMVYGGMAEWDFGAGEMDVLGASWKYLDGDVIEIDRYPDGSVADRVRVRIWVAPEPGADTGWTGLAAGDNVLPIDPPNYPSSWVVDMQMQSNGGGCGTNHYGFGGDLHYINGTTPASLGPAWRELENFSITVTAGDYGCGDRARVRIWDNQAFDYDSGWASQGSLRTFNHALGVPADELVVDMQFKDIDLGEIHTIGYGMSQFNGGGGGAYGAAWWNLTDSGLAISRHGTDQQVDSSRVRLWWTGPPLPLFADGFESGTTSTWSSALP